MAVDPLAIIAQRESNNRNVRNYKYGPGFTASGYFQITNPTWARWAKAAGIDLGKYPTAESAPYDVQRQVAAHGYQTEGFRPWEAVKHLRGQEKDYPILPAGVADANPTTAAPYVPVDLSGYLANKGVDTSGFGGALNQGLGRMLADMPPELRGQITIKSGFRTPERQAQLWQEALQKYGSAEAARKWVAPPGRSQHGFGNAGDLAFGSDAARQWAHANAAKYGLAFPLGNEPWHIEAAGARVGGKPVNYALGAPGQPTSGGTQVASATGAATPQSGQPAPVDPASPEALTQAGVQQLEGLLGSNPTQAQPEQVAATQPAAPPVTEVAPTSVPQMPEQGGAASLMASLLDRKRQERGVLPTGFLG